MLSQPQQICWRKMRLADVRVTQPGGVCFSQALALWPGQVKWMLQPGLEARLTHQPGVSVSGKVVLFALTASAVAVTAPRCPSALTALSLGS